MTRTIISTADAAKAAVIRQRALQAQRDGEDILLRYSERVNGRLQMTFDHATLTEREVRQLLTAD